VPSTTGNRGQFDKHIVISNASIEVESGHFAAIYGNSGCGKSTLLNLLGLLDAADSGVIEVGGVVADLNKLSKKESCRIRNEKIGFIFQNHNLLPEFSAEMNVAMPLLIRGVGKGKALKEARNLINDLFSHDEVNGGIAHRSPTKLSGGQCQRIAIARALVASPSIILADEPTGNLDETSSDKFFDLLLNIQKRRSLTILMVTHNPSHADKVDYHYKMSGGNLVKY
jgi:lipoprotein-releasing system ATP-binding protein